MGPTLKLHVMDEGGGTGFLNFHRYCLVGGARQPQSGHQNQDLRWICEAIGSGLWSRKSQARASCGTLFFSPYQGEPHTK